MSTPDPTSFARTRSDHANELAEDYVEAIAGRIAAQGSCRVMDLAEQFGVSHVTVVRTLQRLEREGLVKNERNQPVELTPEGARLAKESKERHEIVLAFLIAIGISPETAAIDAEGIEHHVSEETLACFKEIIQERRG